MTQHERFYQACAMAMYSPYAHNDNNNVLLIQGFLDCW